MFKNLVEISLRKKSIFSLTKKNKKTCLKYSEIYCETKCLKCC